MNIIKKTLFTLALSVLLFIPQSASADSCTDLQTHFPTSDLSQNINALPQYCTVESVYTKIINIALYAIGIVAVIMVIYGGYTYMTAGGNADQAKRGRTILTWALAGLVVVLAAATIVNVVIRFVVEN